MAERLFQAYFLEGLDIGQAAVLEGLAAELGLTLESVASCLADDGVFDGLRAEDAAARARNISGVPYFVIDGRYSLSGAVAPEVLMRSMELALAAQAAP